MSWPLLRVPLVRIGLIWLVLATILLIRAFPFLAEGRFPDPDDTLRLVQVRDLLGGQGWFDLHQYRIDAPTGTLMHWSRLVDAPLAVVIGLLTPLFGAGAAETVALIAVPLLTLFAILVVVQRIAARVMDVKGETFACLCLGLSALVLAQVQPTRIDHHGWQLFTAILALAGLLARREVRGAMLSGAAMALGLSISMELLPLAAAFGAVFALRWVADGRNARPLVAYLMALAGALAALFLATRGLVDLVEHCDAVSPGHIGFFAIAALGAAGVARLAPRSRPLLVALLALPVLVALGFYLWSAPQCTAGPFGNLDPLVRDLWYNNVLEGRPFWRLRPVLWGPLVLQGMIVLAVLVRLWLGAEGAERRWWLEYLLITVAAFATGLLVWRSMGFVGVFSAIPLGWLAVRLLALLHEIERPLGKIAIGATLILALVPAFPVAAVQALMPRNAAEPVEAGNSQACHLTGEAATLGKLAPATIFAPLDLGPALLHGSHHSVVATAHHRAEAAMHDVLAAFTGTPEAARTLIARHRADYVLLCTEMGEMGVYRAKAPRGFAAQLAAGKVPAWLEPVPLDAPEAVRLWRVVPAE